MKARMLGAVALGLLAAACGTEPRDRVGGGAATGAAAGAGVGALGGPVGVLAGAGIGAAAGAATGAVTTPDQVNLGRPVWNDPEVRVPGVREGGSSSGSSGRGSASSSNTRQLQQALNDRGFNAGPADGVYGARTRQAVMDWQRANNQEPTGRPNAQMMSALNVSGSDNVADTRSGSRTARSERDRAYMGGGMVGDGRTGGSTGTAGTRAGGMGSSGAMTGSSSAPMGNIDAQGPDRRGGTGGTLGGGRGVQSPSASPDNPGSGSNSAGSSSN
jgi:peptidoglycan hydrolase-like protein with peptidoglycan-binding domain